MDSRGSPNFSSNLLVGILVALISVTALTGVLAYSSISNLQNNYNILQAKYDALTTQTLGENLTVESYTPRIFSRQAIQLNLKNIGTTDIKITDVKVNGCSNQTYSDHVSSFTQGWNGTTYLTPNQSGPLYVYMPCYIAAINKSIPHWPSMPTQQDIENFENYLQSSNLNFTVTTRTGRQYNFTDPKGNVFLALAVWMGSLSFNFMGTEQLTFTNYVWGTNTITITVKNTGSSDLSIQDVRVDGITVTDATYNPDKSMPYALPKGGSVQITIPRSFRAGVQYEFTIITSKGNIFGPYIKTAPGQTQQAGVFLNRDAVSWPTNATITLYVRNTGTSDAIIDSVYIGTSASNLEKQTSVVYDPPNGAVAANGGVVRVTIARSWSTGTTYYFRVVPKVGPPLEFNIRAP